MTRIRLTALAVAAVSVFAGCSTSESDARTVVAYFQDVGDLVERASVQYNDIEIGRVTDIELALAEDDMVARVTMRLSDKVRMPSDDLGATVRQTSLLGEQFIELDPAVSGPPYVEPGDRVTIPVARTDRLVDVETFLGDLAGFIGGGGLEDLNRFTHAQALILEDRGERFGQTLEELERFTAVLADRKLDI
ncbi:MAG TPA: MlaD family protein, partial [Actinomycetota bacterium]